MIQVYSTNEWAVFYFHQILPNVVNSPDVINTQTFTSLLDYIKSKGIPTLTVNEALNLVSPPAPPPSVTINPTSAKMDIGQSQKFSSSITGGNPTYSYQWYLNDAAIPGATSSTWIFSPTSTGTYNVYLNVTDALGYEVQSNIATNINVYAKPTVSISPSTVNMATGTSQTFVSTVSGGAAPYSYQWFRNGTAISGATNANYVFTPTVAGTYRIYLKVTDYAGVSVNSPNSTARVEVLMNVAVTPTHVGIYVGQLQTFSSSVSGGTSPYTYQWFLNGSAVSGATSASWTFTPGSAGNYMVYVKVTDGYNLNAQSNVVTDISVYSLLTVSVSPRSADMTVGGSTAI